MHQHAARTPSCPDDKTQGGSFPPAHPALILGPQVDVPGSPYRTSPYAAVRPQPPASASQASHMLTAHSHIAPSATHSPGDGGSGGEGGAGGGDGATEMDPTTKPSV